MTQHKVLPELIQILESQPELILETDLEACRQIPDFGYKQSKAIRIQTVSVKGYNSERTIKLYTPVNHEKDKLPGVFWMHGGGFVLGHPDVDDAMAEKIALETHCVVASIDYGLAPENPYPAALEDCYAGLKWFFDHAAELSVDTNKIAIAGQSAGGGLTAALALLVRDRKTLSLAFQMPLYPMIDDRNQSPSSYEITRQNFPKAWNRENNKVAWELYLGTVDRKTLPYYAAPARAEDLSGLPPTYTCVGQLDPFRDETMDYVKRLAHAGVPVEFHLYPGCFHGFDALMGNTEIGRKAVDAYIGALRQALS